MENDHVLGIFPEGTRYKIGEPGRPKSGMALIAKMTQADILPCCVLYEPGKKFRSKTVVRFGELIPFEELGFETDSPREIDHRVVDVAHHLSVVVDDHHVFALAVQLRRFQHVFNVGVHHDEQRFVGNPFDQLINPNVGYMLQRDNLLDWRTIYKNVLLGLEIQHQLDKESVAYAEELLKTYGLWEFRDKYPAQLSGGMRQRAALIDPSLLLVNFQQVVDLLWKTQLAIQNPSSASTKK